MTSNAERHFFCEMYNGTLENFFIGFYAGYKGAVILLQFVILRSTAYIFFQRIVKTPPKGYEVPYLSKTKSDIDEIL